MKQRQKLTSCALDDQSNGEDERGDQQGLHGEPEEVSYDSGELGGSYILDLSQ